MSCLITKGRQIPCKDKVGGLYKIWFANFGTLSGLSFSILDDTISGSTYADLFEYKLKGTSTLDQQLTSSSENGTTFVTQTLTLSLVGLSAQDNHEIMLLAYGRPHVFVQDNNGYTWLVGKTYGVDLQTGDSKTGAAMGDAYAYTLTFVAKEKQYANLVYNSTLDNPFGNIEINGNIVTDQIIEQQS